MECGLIVSGLTYIIIILILISIFVTCSEVFLRFGILSARAPGSDSKQNYLPLVLPHYRRSDTETCRTHDFSSNLHSKDYI